MATMSMMKKALHMGTRDTERAARIFLEALIRIDSDHSHSLSLSRIFLEALAGGVPSHARRVVTRVGTWSSALCLVPTGGSHLRRPKRRTTRRARRMLTGKSRGPRATRDMKTTRASKTDL